MGILLTSTIPDIPGWFSPASALSFMGVLIFILCVLFIFSRMTMFVMGVAFFGWFWVGISSPAWDSDRINGYSRMSIFYHFPTQTTEYRIDRRVFEADIERERRLGRYSTTEYSNVSESRGIRSIFAMHYPYDFNDPDPRVQNIRQVSHRFWHPACLFWSPFFATIIVGFPVYCARASVR